MILVAIPARHAASRFPGKPLAPIAGRPMIGWVVEHARAARRADDVVVVTDREAIAEAAEAAGGRAVVDDRPATSGTDRVARLLELDRVAGRADVVVNLQGDEPLLEPETIDATVDALLADPEADLATPVRELRSGERLDDPHLVKARLGPDGRALDFSRAPMVEADRGWVHVGLYAYRRTAFDRFAATPPTERERAEGLEQLRALDLGLVVRCVPVVTGAVGVDVPADVARVEAALDGP